MSKKKEFNIGATFRCGLVTLKCEKQKKIMHIAAQVAFFHYRCFRDIVTEIAGYCNRYEREDARKRINFAKHLLLKYPDTSVELSNEELNKEWHEVIK